MHDWLDKREYPFQSRFHDLPIGRMHYLDEGLSDHAVVMIHGNPAWSFTYRKWMRCLSGDYRCIVPDHIGFGLSDKPRDWSYLPSGHALNLERLLDHLGLQSMTLVVGDWGGPIGLWYAVNHPERIRSLVVTNSWAWSVQGVLHYEVFSRIIGGTLGRTLIRRYNFFAKVLMTRMFRASLDPEVHRHYLAPLATPDDRKGCWVFPREIIGSSRWLDEIWRKSDAIADKPMLILWGKRDIAFRDIELDRWRSAFSDLQVYEFENAGHFIAEDVGEDACPMLKAHLARVYG